MTDIEFGLSMRRSDDVAAQARQIEELGYDYATSGEHVFFHVPVSNAFISLAVAAGATSTLKLMSTITLLPLYPAVLAAKQAAALDVASGGRFNLGVGVGGELPKEFEASGVPVTERGARTNEALEVMRRLFTEDDVHFEGRFTTLSGVTLAPKPTQKPGPPVWISGRKDAAWKRAARYGDAWLPYMYTPEMLVESNERIAELGLTGLLPSVSVSCNNHEGANPAIKVQQWDGAKWVTKTDWIPSMTDVVRPLMEKDAAQYASVKGISPRSCN